MAQVYTQRLAQQAKCVSDYLKVLSTSYIKVACLKFIQS
ncbi:hypothetical protein MICAH_360031 [Microcystis aeruginosa PCC 9809]|uniref:Uncharacterized protein n=2 Tax=Microcystis aeruginosa TaxID=1126 RepID=I4HUC3_MICAE|nr:hypothetical protein MSj_01906 [Microcystis aeruginosa Sj]CCI25647.1 hypothetical protein MICAH_360031 [Microcystis aeruginosa PCC 9809]